MVRARRVELSPDQRDIIERKITEFVRGEAHEDCRKAAGSAHALPLYLDWTACMALRPDGQVIWIDYDEPHQVQAVKNERERNVGLSTHPGILVDFLFVGILFSPLWLPALIIGGLVVFFCVPGLRGRSPSNQISTWAGRRLATESMPIPVAPVPRAGQ